MSFEIRRVVTGHDANGKAIVLYDEIGKEVSSGRPGATALVRVDHRRLADRQ